MPRVVDPLKAEFLALIGTCGLCGGLVYAACQTRFRVKNDVVIVGGIGIPETPSCSKCGASSRMPKLEMEERRDG